MHQLMLGVPCHHAGSEHESLLVGLHGSAAVDAVFQDAVNDWRRALRLDAQGTFRAVQCEALVVIACS